MWWKSLGLVLGLAVAGGGFAYVGHRVAVGVRWRLPGRVVPAAVVWHKSGDLRQVEDLRQIELSRGDRGLAAALRMLLRKMDSLRNDSSGRRVYDSLVELRPGLLDSARVAERFYSLQEFLNK